MKAGATYPQARTNIPGDYMRLLTTAALTCLLATVVITAQGQQPPANPTNKTGVIGLMHAIHSTNDVDKTLAFYLRSSGQAARCARSRVPVRRF